MSTAVRYSDQHWQLERQLADKHAEHLLIMREIQQRYKLLNDIEQDMKRLQSELEYYDLGEPS